MKNEELKAAAVRVPASSANLGPGFDTLGLALELYLEARVSGAERNQVRISGPHAEGIAADETNLVLAAFRAGFERAGRTAPEVALSLHNSIPLGRGLGSSGAAMVAGVALANEYGNLGMSRDGVLDLAAEMEGHPDNVAASCLGGLAIACPGSGGGIQALSLPWPKAVTVVIAVPEFQLETKKARAALPENYSRADAVFNLQRAALLVGGVASGGNPRALAAALADRLHQPFRAPLVPGLREALDLQAPGLLGVALSGAGPSLIAFIEGAPDAAVSALRWLYRGLHLRAEVQPVAVDARGYSMVL